MRRTERDDDDEEEGSQDGAKLSTAAFVQKVKDRRHESSTYAGYGGKIVHLVAFLFANFLHALRAAFVAEYKLVDEKSRYNWVKERAISVKKEQKETWILEADQLDSNMIDAWLAGFKARDGVSMPSRSVYGTAMSALKDLYRQQGGVFPDAISQSAKAYEKGARKMRAEQRAQGDLPAQEGKAHVTADLYQNLARVLLKSGDVFLLAFVVLSWNLMVRVSNVADLRGSSLAFSNDSISICYVKHKADQTGDRTDPKHCYANPFNPSVCIVTALGLYFACYSPPKTKKDTVFQGTRQEDRFVKGLRAVLEKHPDLKKALEDRGLDVEDIAAHSFRKGGRSYLAGGTTMGPPTPSALLRGGWSLEGIDGKYVRYEHAGDQWIGRLLAMLDFLSADFAILPPHFNVVDDDVYEATNLVFPGAAVEIRGVLVMCLASLVYHREYFRANLEKDHPIFKTVLFTQGIADRLGARVALKFENDLMTPTGVPPLTKILGQVERLSAQTANLPEVLRTAIHDEFEQRQFDAGNITRDAVQGMMDALTTRLIAAVSLSSGAQPGAELAQEVPHDHLRFPGHWWGGKRHPVPEGFVLDTKVTAPKLFQLYVLGDQSTNIEPYRFITANDVLGKQAKARVSDMQALMLPVVESLKKQNKWFPKPTVAEANMMWESGNAAIVCAETTPNKRKRRNKELAWTTVLNNMRKKQRADHEAESDDEGVAGDSDDEQ